VAAGLILTATICSTGRIKAKYPGIKIISERRAVPQRFPLALCLGQIPHGGTPADVVDEHYYVAPRWLYENVNRYDGYDRKGPKIFVGEFAAHDGAARRNNLRAALAEAAYMTGLWKNADEVLLASYAPLFGKVGPRPVAPEFDLVRQLPRRADAVLLCPGAVRAKPAGRGSAGERRGAERRGISCRHDRRGRLEHAGGIQGHPRHRSRAAGSCMPAISRKAWRAGKRRAATGPWWTAPCGRMPLARTSARSRGIPAWTNYTLTLKARKLDGGSEGFLVLFQTPDIAPPGLVEPRRLGQHRTFTARRRPGGRPRARFHRNQPLV
jgi:hypothetical protein